MSLMSQSWIEAYSGWWDCEKRKKQCMFTEKKMNAEGGRGGGRGREKIGKEGYIC